MPYDATMSEPQLTEPQRRMLAAVRAAGAKRYNGRARRTIKALENAGLVDVDWDLVLHAKGDTTWRITVTPKGQHSRADDRGVVEVFNPAAYEASTRYYDEADGRWRIRARVMTCGTCHRSWDDAVATAWTPTPSARCPYEYDHGERG